MYTKPVQKTILTLIGSEIKLVNSSTRTLKGLIGLVLDESKNMFTIIRRNKRILRVPKKTVRISYRKNNQLVTVNGSKLIGLPENRIKNYYGRS